jgi:hypothetical protein
MWCCRDCVSVGMRVFMAAPPHVPSLGTAALLCMSSLAHALLHAYRPSVPQGQGRHPGYFEGRSLTDAGFDLAGAHVDSKGHRILLNATVPSATKRWLADLRRALRIGEPHRYLHGELQGKIRRMPHLSVDGVAERCVFV